MHVLALDCLDHFHVLEVLGMHVTRCHVIGKDVHELRLRRVVAWGGVAWWGEAWRGVARVGGGGQ